MPKLFSVFQKCGKARQSLPSQTTADHTADHNEVTLDQHVRENGSGPTTLELMPVREGGHGSGSSGRTLEHMPVAFLSRQAPSLHASDGRGPTTSEKVGGAGRFHGEIEL
jgi:hypothetical protein